MNNVLSKDYDIGDVNTAKNKILKLLKDKYGYTWYAIYPLNKDRYYMVFGKPENILIMFKRDVFFNFGKQFKDQGMSGVGDTININELKIAIKNDVKTIYSIFPDEKIYYIPLQEFLEKSIAWINKEGRHIRSISVHEYKRVNLDD